MKSLFISIFLFIIASTLTVSASIVAPTPAVDLQKRQSSSGSSITDIGQFSLGGLDPTLSSLLSERLQTASSIVASQSTIAFTSVSSSACPQGGRLPNGECCTSGTVIAGKCFQGTSSTTSAPAQTTTSSRGQGDSASSLRIVTSAGSFVCFLLPFLLGYAFVFA